MPKQDVIDAIADFQTSLEDLGAKWQTCVSAHAAYKHELVAASERGGLNLDNSLSLRALRRLVVECARANRLRYLFEETGTADGLAATGAVPDGIADLESAATSRLGGLA